MPPLRGLENLRGGNFYKHGAPSELAASDAIPLKTAKNRKNVQLACFSADFIDHSADFQSAVSQNCILLAVAMPRGAGAFGRSADCKSATQQIKNLRYARAGMGCLFCRT